MAYKTKDIIEGDFDIEGFTDDRGNFYPIIKINDYVHPIPRTPLIIIDDEKKREEERRRINEQRPTISIEDIADPERK